MIPHVNLSISGYELDSLRTSHMRSPSMWAQEISIMPQLDEPGSLPMRDPIGRRTHEVSRPAEQESSQGNIYIYKGLPPLEEENTERKTVIMMVLEGHIEIGDPLIEEDIQTKVGDPLTEKDTLIEDLLEKDILIGMGDPWKRRIPWQRTS